MQRSAADFYSKYCGCTLRTCSQVLIRALFLEEVVIEAAAEGEQHSNYNNEAEHVLHC
jgi:hypothetical protein